MHEWYVLGGSGGFVNSVDFYPASLKSHGCFYFQCVLSSSEFTKYTVPTLKAFLKAYNQNVSDNK